MSADICFGSPCKCIVCGWDKVQHSVPGMHCPVWINGCNPVTTFSPEAEKGKPVTTQPDYSEHTLIMSTGDKYRLGIFEVERVKTAIREQRGLIEVATVSGRRVLIAPQSVAVIERCYEEDGAPDVAWREMLTDIAATHPTEAEMRIIVGYARSLQQRTHV